MKTLEELASDYEERVNSKKMRDAFHVTDLIEVDNKIRGKYIKLYR